MRLENKEKLLRKVVKKYPTLSIDNKWIKGEIIVKSVRFYGDQGDIVNVDIVFNGEIYAKYNDNTEARWFSKKTYKSFTKKSLNRYIRMAIYSRLKTYLYYFSIKLNNRRDIKKIIL